MNHLVIFAHPRQSLNQTILDLVVSTLLNNGHQVTVRDLYSLNFQPGITKEEKIAMKTGDMPEAIQLEQMLIKEADVLTFIFPIWWTGLPTILKDYVELVFSEGFAYRVTEHGIESLLHHKKGVIINTHDAPKNVHHTNSVATNLHMTTDTEVFQFIGVEPVERLLFGSIDRASADYIHEILQETRETVDQLFPPAV
ncbi:NAD(P)H-dependent oxidoreductase [Bacillus sp. NPDC093026]|uniref:NAD(P)H-dependent oxidoreductase n=1 Tax=Bacillus sp. NPDC093026 TaxID=3363948 RepID=UPI003826BE4F